MSDLDQGGAWRLPPSEYLKRRPATFAVGAPRSCYVAMRDGCKLAVDVYLPEASDGAKPAARLPAVLILTPYYRRFAVSAPGVDPSPNAAKYRDFFVARGYALVVVDVRGCGASFGTRDSFRSPREREDSREIADWVVAQPWSSGVIGATGISYLGAAACFLASTGHPAVKAIAPLFATSDTYSDHLYPGGVLCTMVSETYDDLVSALDMDLRERLKKFAYFNDPRFAGPQPVDEDRDGSMLRAAIDEHRDNFHMRDFAPDIAYREEPVPYDRNLHSGAISPYWYLSAAKGKVAIYSISGWYDGGQYSNASISRFLTQAGAHDRLLLGPWDHGARTNGSPWRGAAQEPQFPLMGEVLRFFDEHLCGMETGLRDEAPIHYHSVREERWHAASQWPPIGTKTRLHLASDGRLAKDRPAQASRASYQARFTTGTGNATRYERLGAFVVAEYYADWNGREERMLTFTSEPFDREIEIAGHPVLTLRVATSEGDASLFAYLSEVDANGRSWYMTEGVLRLLHRATAECPPTYRTTWPFHSFHREQAKAMKPGTPETVQLALLPIAWKLAKGSRVRVSVCGADADHFAQVPHGRPPKLEVTLGGSDGSFVDLPMR